MIPALVGFAVGWFLRGLWQQRASAAETAPVEAPMPGTATDTDVAPAAAFDRGRPTAPDAGAL